MNYLPKVRKVPVSKIIMLIDDREKQPWSFERCKYKIESIRQRLNAGDYTFKGYESKIAIEKKSGWAEFMCNISAADKPRFTAALIKLAAYPVKYFVIEDSLDTLPRKLKELPKKAKITEYAVQYWLYKIICEYKIPVILLGSNKAIASRALNVLLEQIIEIDLPRVK